MEEIKWILVVGGVWCFCGAWFDMDFFMESPAAHPVVSVLGRKGARIFYGLLGIACLTYSLLLFTGVVPNHKPLPHEGSSVEIGHKQVPREAVVLEEERNQAPQKYIPARDPRAPANLIDLSPYYNGALTNDGSGDYQHDFIGLPAGLQKLAGVEFDVRGVIQLFGSGLVSLFPDAEQTNAVENIPTNRKFARLSVLHGTSFSEAAGVQIATLVLKYADGQRRELPIVYGKDLRDYWFGPDDPATVGSSGVAWIGSNEQTTARNRQIRLYKTSWDNPLPEIPVVGIDYVSSMTGASPFLIALTVE